MLPSASVPVPATWRDLLEELAPVADRGQLQAEPKAHVIAAPLRDQPEVLVIEVEHPVQLGPRRRTRVPAEHGLFISQELHRHARNIAPTSR